MAKNTSPKIQEIDTNVKAEMRMLDTSHSNVLDNAYGLVMEPAPIMKATSFGVPNRAPEHRILYMKHGSMRLSVNFMDYSLLQGDILTIPANFIVSINHLSHDAQPWMLAFRFNVSEEQSLVGIEPMNPSPDINEQRMIEDYFRLMREVLTRPIPNKDDFRHLVLSLLYRVQKLHASTTGHAKVDMGSRAKQLKSEFINLVVSQDPPKRSISFYADRLNVTSNYLSIIIKQETERTVMDWVEDKIDALIKMLLTSPKNLTLEQIAEHCGYTTGNQVSRFFKNRNGITPAEYRKSVASTSN